MTAPTATTPVPLDGIPDELKSWAHILTAHHLDGVPGIRRAVSKRDTDELEVMAEDIPYYLETPPEILDGLGLPMPEEPSVWELALPIVKNELGRRRRPKPTPTANSPIARLKGLDLVTVADRFAELTHVGDKMRGLCPLHSEKTASFYIYPHRQRWRCFGACAKGGDVVDLLEALAEQGKRL